MLLEPHPHRPQGWLTRAPCQLRVLIQNLRRIRNKDKDIEFVALAFEYAKTEETAFKNIKRIFLRILKTLGKILILYYYILDYCDKDDYVENKYDLL